MAFTLSSSVLSIRQIAFIVSLFFTIHIFAEPKPFSLSSGAWIRIPKEAEEFDGSISIPPKFREVKPLISSHPKMILNVRAKSPEGDAEFAVAARSVRFDERSVEARTLPFHLESGERIVDRSPTSQKKSSGGIQYIHFTESITVQGPANRYTRYIFYHVSTSNLPGAASILWEFKVRNEVVRKKYQNTYKQFKKGLDLGEF